MYKVLTEFGILDPQFVPQFLKRFLNAMPSTELSDSFRFWPNKQFAPVKKMTWQLGLAHRTHISFKETPDSFLQELTVKSVGMFNLKLINHLLRCRSQHLVELYNYILSDAFPQ
jgi:hypothetical protein